GAARNGLGAEGAGADRVVHVVVLIGAEVRHGTIGDLVVGEEDGGVGHSGWLADVRALTGAASLGLLLRALAAREDPAVDPEAGRFLRALSRNDETRGADAGNAVQEGDGLTRG